MLCGAFSPELHVPDGAWGAPFQLWFPAASSLNPSTFGETRGAPSPAGRGQLGCLLHVSPPKSRWEVQKASRTTRRNAMSWSIWLAVLVFLFDSLHLWHHAAVLASSQSSRLSQASSPIFQFIGLKRFDA